MEPYDHFDALMDRARSEAAGKPLCNNTRLFRRGEDVLAIRLHQTDVVTLWADGRVSLDSGGWQTVTTKDRMNSYAPVTVSSRKGQWYVSHRATHAKAERDAMRELGIPKSQVERLSGGTHYVRFFDNAEYGTPEYDEARKLSRAYYNLVSRKTEVPYFDGIMFDAEGNCTNGIDPETWTAYLRVVAERTKMVQTYCTGFIRALKGGMEAPGSGDCWYCSMRTDNGLALGDESGSVDHLLAHIEESYYVPSLAFNALKESGYRDVGVAIHLGYNPDTGTIGGEQWASRQTGNGGGLVRRDLRNYLLRRLLPDPPSERNGFRFDGETFPLIARHRAERMAGR